MRCLYSDASKSCAAADPVNCGELLVERGGNMFDDENLKCGNP